jgi:hypothetical protein
VTGTDTAVERRLKPLRPEHTDAVDELAFRRWVATLITAPPQGENMTTTSTDIDRALAHMTRTVDALASASFGTHPRAARDSLHEAATFTREILIPRLAGGDTLPTARYVVRLLGEALEFLGRAGVDFDDTRESCAMALAIVDRLVESPAGGAQ